MRYRMGSALVAVLFWLALGDVGAGQQTAGASSSSSFSTGRSSDETTVGGVIREVLAKKPVGAPMGLNFVMTGSQRELTVSVGRDLPQVRDLLKVGETVRVTGVVRSFGGQDYLMAREVVAGGQTIVLRNSNGFPIRAKANGASQPKHVESDLRGGAR